MLKRAIEQMRALEEKTGKTFGGNDNPLLVSVRSGSAMSMPGMMDTILNLGLNIETLKGLIAQTGNERFGWDAYRRFIQLFGKVALGVPDEAFDAERFSELEEIIQHHDGYAAEARAAEIKDGAAKFLLIQFRDHHAGMLVKPFALCIRLFANMTAEDTAVVNAADPAARSAATAATGRSRSRSTRSAAATPTPATSRASLSGASGTPGRSPLCSASWTTPSSTTSWCSGSTGTLPPLLRT